jgi:putative ABC transport system permease protein|tara:strand:+ start:8826 stop:10106 length:1281 start_codon:yes stop_codon:yes gene_type:complete
MEWWYRRVYLSIFDAINFAFRSIISTPLRSGLTALGVIVGVTSVIVLVSLGQGIKKQVEDEITALGTNLLFITASSEDSTTGVQGSRNSGLSLTLSDAEKLISSNISGVRNIAPQIDFPAQLIAGNYNVEATVFGTTPEYIDVISTETLSGEFITQKDVDTKALRMVLGSEIAKTLFPDQEPIGKIVRLSLFNRFDFRFLVTGVMKPKGGKDDDDFSVFIPVSTMQNRIGFLRNPTGDVNVFRIIVRSEDGVEKELVSNKISENLKLIHNVDKPDFEITSMDQLLEASNQVTGALTLFLGSIAGISLLVGAIGVGNIMLVSVTERTREIGTLRSIGATKFDIRLQFVTEALTICLLGGVLGIIIGIIICLNLSDISFGEAENLSAVVTPTSVIVAFVVSFFVGLISGAYPAYRASELDPIEALRSE